VSIYGTIFDLEDNPPYAYTGSHVLPQETDGRDASCTVQLAEIPSHITRDGRDDQPEDGAPWPWLRYSLGQEDVVLDRAQVQGMWEVMGAWLEQTKPSVPPAKHRNTAADTLAAEWHRRNQRLEELTKSRGPEAQVAVVEHVRGELIGLRGALGVLLGGRVEDGTADLLGWSYYQEWRQGSDLEAGR